MKKQILLFFLVLAICSPLSTAFAEDGYDCSKVVCKINPDCSKPGNEQYECCCYKIEFREKIGKDDMIVGKSGVDLMKNYIHIIYVYGASILGIICVLIIVISGIQITMGGAQADLVASAKTRIFQALLSLALLFLSAVILKTINPGFFIGP